MRGFFLLVLVCVLAAGGALAVLALLNGDDEPPSYGPVTLDPGEPDPFAWEPEREDEFVARAIAGHSHVLYEKSPGGVLASARRVERWRPKVDDVAEEAGVEADLLEAMVFLESAGYPDARAGDDLEGAVGLTQILAETATSFLGLRVDLAASERLTRRIRKRGPSPALLAKRREVDERFDPDKALAAAGRYLETAKERFGREDLAVASYHMGIGNLDNVLAAYGDRDASWAQVYFDATPRNHPRTYKLLSGFGDDSATYLWRVYAAREIMRLYREDRDELRRLNALQTGELARRIDAERRLFRGLRPEAYALSVYLSAGVRDVGGTKASLIATSSVRDLSYQRALARRNAFATREYSLHTTGFAFDIRRKYASRSQAVAFEYMLDRLQSLNLIAWVREPGAIHITASGEAGELRALIQ
jgi:hypothetical protein